MTLKIQISNNTYLTSDSRQFMISDFKGHDKNGKEQWHNRSFHTSIEGALKTYTQQETLKCDATSFEELTYKLIEVENVLHEVREQLAKARGKK